MKLAAFLIHLKRATQRRPQVERIIEACPLDIAVVDAVDGRAMSEAEQAKVYKFEKQFEPPYPFRIGPGEIGCFLSHRRCWQRTVDGNADAGLILEDDVEIDADVFAKAIELATDHIAEIGYIQFQVRAIPGASRIVDARDGHRLIFPATVPRRTSAQLVSRDAAKHLLRLTDTFDRPIDGFLQLTWETKIPVACIEPSGVTDRTAQSGGSTITPHAKGSLLARLSGNIYREALRLWYRWQVASASRRQRP
ncbi:MAG: glycosyltransferase family 25 protein [Rhizobiaceae bacterium]